MPTQAPAAAGLPVLRVTGVPEHFNRPWHLALQRHAFRAAGVELRFASEKSGTGAMVQAVADGAQDVAVALTEGLLAAVVANNAAVAAAGAGSGAEPLRYVGEFVTSPLRWMVAAGVHAPRWGPRSEPRDGDPDRD